MEQCISTHHHSARILCSPNCLSYPCSTALRITSRIREPLGNFFIFNRKRSDTSCILFLKCNAVWFISPLPVVAQPSDYRILQLIMRSRVQFLAAMLAFWLGWNTRTLVYLRFRCTLASPRYSKLVRSPPMYVSHSLRVAVEDVKSDGSNHFFFPSNCWLPFTNSGQDKAHQWESNYSEFAKWWCYSSFMFMSFFSFEKVVLLAMIHYVQTVIYQYSLT